MRFSRARLIAYFFGLFVMITTATQLHARYIDECLEHLSMYRHGQASAVNSLEAMDALILRDKDRANDILFENSNDFIPGIAVASHNHQTSSRKVQFSNDIAALACGAVAFSDLIDRRGGLPEGFSDVFGKSLKDCITQESYRRCKPKIMMEVVNHYDGFFSSETKDQRRSRTALSLLAVESIVLHEYAHHLLGHLDGTSTPQDSRKDEFDADVYALFTSMIDGNPAYGPTKFYSGLRYMDIFVPVHKSSSHDPNNCRFFNNQLILPLTEMAALMIQISRNDASYILVNIEDVGDTLIAGIVRNAMDITKENRECTLPSEARTRSLETDTRLLWANFRDNLLAIQSGSNPENFPGYRSIDLDVTELEALVDGFLDLPLENQEVRIVRNTIVSNLLRRTLYSASLFFVKEPFFRRVMAKMAGEVTTPTFGQMYLPLVFKESLAGEGFSHEKFRALMAEANPFLRIDPDWGRLNAEYAAFIGNCAHAEAQWDRASIHEFVAGFAQVPAGREMGVFLRETPLWKHHKWFKEHLAETGHCHFRPGLFGTVKE